MFTEVPRAVKYPGLREPVSGRTRATAALLREVRLKLTLEKSSSSSGRREGRTCRQRRAGWGL